MKKITDITTPPGRTELVYSTFFDNLFGNDNMYSLEWASANYRETRFSAVRNRDRSVEFRLKFVNSLLLEFHAHCYWMTIENDWGNDYVFLKDENPDLSKEVLLRAWDYTQVILENLLKAGEHLHREYFILAASLMMEIISHLNKYGTYLNPVEQLHRLVGTKEKTNPFLFSH